MKKNWIKYIGVFVLGIVLGWIFFSSGEESTTEESGTHVHIEGEDHIWTCSMHPQIRQNGPGQCPICGMDLIPLDESSSEAGPDEVTMTQSAIELANIQTQKVKREIPSKIIYLNGRVKPDETRIFSQTAHIPGRIEKLYVNFTGEKVVKGQKLAAVYSPELITAQKELFEIKNSPEPNPFLLEAARNKLKLWKFSDEQIAELEKNGELQTELDILADHSGFVYMRHVALGDHVKEGQSLLKIVNLSTVWFMFEAYESDLPWIHTGDEIEIQVQAMPGVPVTGKINYIDPFINPTTRTANVRVELDNPGTKYKLDMFATGIINSVLPIKEPAILIPKSSVLWTGKRSIVYIKVPDRESPSFILREIELGEDAGEYYVVKSGLEEGDEIVVNGVFKIDASAQLSGKPSMMNPDGGPSSSGHNHGDNSDSGTNSNNKKKVKKKEEEKKMQCAPGKCGGAEGSEKEMQCAPGKCGGGE